MEMMDHEHSKIVKSAAEVLMVYSAQCRYCNNTFDYTIESADTDMVSCYCGSVYSSKDKQLVIAPLTAEEIYNGQAGYLEKRINAVCPKHDYKFCGTEICPYCGKSGIQSSKKGLTIKDYCTRHSNTLILYNNGVSRILKDELDAAYVE